MRFDDLKKMLRCMSAFHQNPEVSEEQRYAKALEQMLFVMQNVHDAAFRIQVNLYGKRSTLAIMLFGDLILRILIGIV